MSRMADMSIDEPGVDAGVGTEPDPVEDDDDVKVDVVDVDVEPRWIETDFSNSRALTTSL